MKTRNAPKNCQKRSFLYDTKAKAIVRETHNRGREQQLEAAVQFCLKNNCRGQKAISQGLCPLIKDRRTINNLLDNPLK